MSSSSHESPSISTPTSSNSISLPIPNSDSLMSPASVNIVDNHEAVHEKLLEKAKLREELIKQNHEKAEELAHAADAAMESGEYVQAACFYSDAIRKWNTNVDLHVKLATAYVKSGQYEQAAFIATRALTLHPKNLEARYQRALARFSQDLLKAAHIDLTCILSHSEPDGSDVHTRAATTLKQVNACIASRTSSKESNQNGPAGKEKASKARAKREGGKGEELTSDHEELDFDFPRHEEVELDIVELSDSEECAQVGNWVPCRYHNRREMGCAKGSACGFMHAPDEKSVRDNLGRNVCLYLLLGSCRYQDQCVYSHSKEWLPTSKGWWNSSAQTERMRNLVALAKENAKQQRELDRHLQLQQIELQRHYRPPQRQQQQHTTHGRSQVQQDRRTRQSNGSRGRRSNGVPTNGATGNGRQQQQYKYNNTRQNLPRGQGNKPSDPTPTMRHPSLGTTARLVEHMENFGFGEDEVEELLNQGVKPWDDDARDVMHALSYM